MKQQLAFVLVVITLAGNVFSISLSCLQCGTNEIALPGQDVCESTCSDSCVPVSNDISQLSCVCKPKFVRLNGRCIPKTSCPSASGLESGAITLTLDLGGASVHGGSQSGGGLIQTVSQSGDASIQPGTQSNSANAASGGSIIQQTGSGSTAIQQSGTQSQSVVVVGNSGNSQPGSPSGPISVVQPSNGGVVIPRPRPRPIPIPILPIPSKQSIPIGLPIPGTIPIVQPGLPIGQPGLPIGQSGLPIGQPGPISVVQPGLPIGQSGLPVIQPGGGSPCAQPAGPIVIFQGSGVGNTGSVLGGSNVVQPGSGGVPCVPSQLQQPGGSLVPIPIGAAGSPIITILQPIGSSAGGVPCISG